MRASIIASVFALAGYATAQSLPEGFTLPDCIITCLLTLPNYNGPPPPGTCDPANFACVCASGGPLTNIGCCLTSSCSAADQETAVLWADEMCSNANAKPDNKVVCAGQGTVDATGTLTPNRPEYTDATSVENIATSYKEVVQEGPRTSVPPPWERTMESRFYTSLYPETSTISESATITFAPTKATASVPTYNNSTSAAQPPIFTGAAGRVAAAGPGVVGGIVAALALL